MNTTPQLNKTKKEFDEALQRCYALFVAWKHAQTVAEQQKGAPWWRRMFGSAQARADRLNAKLTTAVTQFINNEQKIFLLRYEECHGKEIGLPLTVESWQGWFERRCSAGESLISYP